LSKYMVFYQKITEGRMFDEGIVINAKDIPTKFSYMATIETETLEDVYCIMNRDTDNPLSTANGQTLVELSGTGHTSMSVNDIIVDLNTGAIYRVKNAGFEVLGIAP
jgi:hypothetical protein